MTTLITAAKETISVPAKIVSPNEWAIPSCPKKLFQSEAKCEAIDLKIIFYSHANRTPFHNKGTLSLVLKLRVFETRKWRIGFLFTENRSRVRLLLVAYIDTVYESFWSFDNRFQVKLSQVMEDTEVTVIK